MTQSSNERTGRTALCRGMPAPPLSAEHCPSTAHGWAGQTPIHISFPSPPWSAVDVLHLSLLLSPKPMSSTPNPTTCSSKFTALLDDALAKYTRLTGRDLRDHPFAYMVDWCESPDEILAIFQEQSQAFDKFRNGDPKLIKWLAPLVKGLYAISRVISAGASLVCPRIAVYCQRT